MTNWVNIDHLEADEVSTLPYIAYGSNLSHKGMRYRCPGAQPLGRGVVAGQLIFRHVADVVEHRRRVVPVGLWEVTPQHVRSLDRYEGWPRLYSRVLVPVQLAHGFNRTVEGFMYIMNTDDLGPPSPGYFSTIRQGYLDFGIRLRPLHEALERSMANISKTPAEVRKRMLCFHSQTTKDRMNLA